MAIGGASLRRATPRRRCGLTLAETVVSALIVGIMLAAALYAVGGVARARSVRLGQDRGLTLAQDLMSEILAAPYHDPTDGGATFGPEAGEQLATRADFDDVDDYAGWAASPPQAKDGTPLSGCGGWSRSVAVSPSPLVTPEDSVREIVVTVEDAVGGVTQLEALRSAFCDPLPPVEEATVVSWVGMELQIGSSADGVRSGVELPNRPAGE